ncbi:MAG: hypothetical protein QOG48_1696 [Verrucomicrobiota bacterium]|jgi:heme/copper-type cytochrome/quinol oxidase subunit 3
MVRAIRIYTLGYPFALVAALFATWFTARVSLGHWPRPSVDDPKQIGGWFDVPYTITGILLIPGLVAFIVAVAALVYRAYRRPLERSRLLTTAVVSVLLMVAADLYLRWDPLRIGDWFMD